MASAPVAVAAQELSGFSRTRSSLASSLRTWRNKPSCPPALWRWERALAALAIQVVHQVAEQLLLVRRSGMVEMLERSLPLDAAEERAGIRKDHDPGAGARQGKGQHVRILGES